MEKAGLNITPREFKRLSKRAENIYNTVVVIEYFVANPPEIEKCYNLAPVIRHLRRDADLLNAFLIVHEEELEKYELSKRCSKIFVLEWYNLSHIQLMFLAERVINYAAWKEPNMTDKLDLLFGTKILNRKTNEIGLLIKTWKN